MNDRAPNSHDEGAASEPPDNLKPDDLKKELELRKLQTELKYYESTLALQQQKLKSDLKDWRFRLISAVVTTLVGVGTFVAGQAIQRSADKQKEQQQEVQQQDSEFNRYLSSLGSADPVQRSLAASAVGRYVEPETLNLPAPGWSKAASTKRAQESVRALARRLLTEGDLLPLEEYSRVLSKAAALALPDVVRVNRAAAADFARNAADYTWWSIDNPSTLKAAKVMKRMSITLAT